MKRIIYLLLALAFLSGFLVTGLAAAQEDPINQKDVAAIENAQEKLSAFSATLGKAGVTEDEVQAHGTTAKEALDALIVRGFFVASFGPDYTAAGAKVKDSATLLRSDVVEAAGLGPDITGPPTVITKTDQATFDAFIARYNQHLTAFNQAVTGFNDAVTAGNKKVEEKKNSETKAMLVPAVIGLIGTVTLFVWANKTSNNPRLKEARLNVAKSSVVPLGGLGITGLSYVFADKFGGKYVISWGLVVIGLYVFGRSIFSYLKNRKILKAGT